MTGELAAAAVALSCMMEGAISKARIMNDPEPLRNLLTMGMDLLRPKGGAAKASIPTLVS